jgi:hypothetical protein
MSKSIYPSIPSPGSSIETIAPCLDAIRQTLTMMILNAQSPNAHYTPSSAAQIFVTHAQLEQLGLVGSSGAPTGKIATGQTRPQTIMDRLSAIETRLASLERKQ